MNQFFLHALNIIVFSAFVTTLSAKTKWWKCAAKSVWGVVVEFLLATTSIECSLKLFYSNKRKEQIWEIIRHSLALSLSISLLFLYLFCCWHSRTSRSFLHAITWKTQLFLWCSNVKNARQTSKKNRREENETTTFIFVANHDKRKETHHTERTTAE